MRYLLALVLMVGCGEVGDEGMTDQYGCIARPPVGVTGTGVLQAAGSITCDQPVPATVPIIDGKRNGQGMAGVINVITLPDECGYSVEYRDLVVGDCQQLLIYLVKTPQAN
jgi:hypothetical protein